MLSTSDFSVFRKRLNGRLLLKNHSLTGLRAVLTPWFFVGMHEFQMLLKVTLQYVGVTFKVGRAKRRESAEVTPFRAFVIPDLELGVSAGGAFCFERYAQSGCLNSSQPFGHP